MQPLVLTTTTARQRTMSLILNLPPRASALAPAIIAAETSFLTYRPRRQRHRQPQLSRMVSTTHSVPPTLLPTSRSLHSTSMMGQGIVALNPHVASPPEPQLPPPSSTVSTKAPLSVLPLAAVLRSLAVTSLSSSPVLLPPSLAVMNMLAHNNNLLLNLDYNPFLKQLIKKTFYAHFCAGEDMREVKQTIARLKEMGFSGVILGYAREVVLTDEETEDLAAHGLVGQAAEESVQNEVIPWANGTLETVRLAEPGDFVAIKFTGAGRQALYSLSRRLPPPGALANAIEEICTLATSRGVRLLFDAEQQAVQAGIDDWTLKYMKKYNRPTATGEPGQAVIYGTYQAYLKATPQVLSAHLRAALDGGFTLGVKLVRGAYLGSDPRHLICNTKADTDTAYDGLAEALILRRWSGPLTAAAQAKEGAQDGAKDADTANFPYVNMVVASHNAESVRKARTILHSREETPAATQVAFAQLQGMADEVSCELVAASGGSRGSAGSIEGVKLRAYKYLVWGSPGECLKYLLRRAQENRDAVQRTESGRDAMRAEVWRRLKTAFGLA